MLSYTITGSDSGTQIILVIDGETFAIDDSHANYPEIYSQLTGQNPLIQSKLKNLVSPTQDILKSYDGKVTVEGSTLYYNGEALYSSLAGTIVNFYRKGLPTTRLVNFLAKLMDNPSRNSREQLYEFLNRHNFSISESGDFIAYKGVNSDFGSLTHGVGIVNGVEQNGSLDNSPGNVLEVSRRDVVDNPGVACAFGLHVGSYEYASGFGPVTVEVQVNPADIVSIPNDSNFQKVRTCQYTVLRQVTSEVDATSRYDTIDAFIRWLQDEVSGYSRKGRVAASFRELADTFVLESGDEVDTNALESFLTEIESRKLTSLSVYRYHVDSLIDDYYQNKEVDEEDDEGDYDEDEWLLVFGEDDEEEEDDEDFY